jgi:hypothetical protein
MFNGARISGKRGRPSNCWRCLDDILFSRSAACWAAFLAVSVMLGCMSVSIGNRGTDEAKSCDGKPCADDNGVLAQEGNLAIRPGTEQIVYYPAAYASPPNLELEDARDYCDLVEQKENFFRVRFHTGFITSKESITWKARGVRCPPAAVPPPASTETTSPGSSSPPAPMPVLTSSPQPR